MKKYMLLMLLLSCASSSLVVGAEASQKDDNSYWIEGSETHYQSFVAAFKAYIDPYCVQAKASEGKYVSINSGTSIMGNTISGSSIYPIGDVFHMSKKTDFPVDTEFSVTWAYQKCQAIKTNDPEKKENVHCVYLYQRNTDNAHLFHLKESRRNRAYTDAIVKQFFPLESNNDTYMFAGTIVGAQGECLETDT